MMTALHPSPVHTPSASAPPTPPYPPFPRLPHASSSGPSISRNASTSSSRSNTTTSSTTSSLVAAPMIPADPKTRTAATTPSRPGSADISASEGTGGTGAGRGDSSHPGILYRGGGFMRNGPRAGRQPISPRVPAINTINGRTSTSLSPSRNPSMSPTTPRALRSPLVDAEEDDDTLGSPGPIRVTVSMDPMDDRTTPPSPLVPRGRMSMPNSPLMSSRQLKAKERPLSAGADRRDIDAQRERRQSQVSVQSSSSASARRPTTKKDWVFGEEIGQGSYSTVVQATPVAALNSPTSSKPPRQYAIKIINQAHLVQEKKVKYAMIERDALVRLALPSPSASPTLGKGHRRGLSSSSSTGTAPAKSSNSIATGKRRSSMTSGTHTRKDSKDRLMINTADLPIGGSAPSSLSPTSGRNLPGRRPSRSAEPPEMVPERSEENVVESPTEELATSPSSPVKEGSEIRADLLTKPPSPVTEETESPDELDSSSIGPNTVSGQPARQDTVTDDSLRQDTVKAATAEGKERDPAEARRSEERARERKEEREKTPKKRRQSLAPSERSVKSVKSSPVAHPGIIRLHGTFNDQKSLYFVLDLAKNGELLTFIRKYGSFDLPSARYYSAQLIDTIEFMHERGVIHRDLKPENILLDENMRIKVTDFGTAKIIGREDPPGTESQKRSFVGSADFVSPEVLRSEDATTGSDIWGFACILYQLIAGKPPFRCATDYLTFQRILKKEMDYPEGFDEDAKALIEIMLKLDPAERPSATEIKLHPFFSAIDFSTLWTMPVPPISTGLAKPTASSAAVDLNSDVWAVFDEDEQVSDGEFQYDDESSPSPTQANTGAQGHRFSPKFDHVAAADALASVSHSVQFPDARAHNRRASHGSLEPPKVAWMEGTRRKSRGWSHSSQAASHRTSSSSSANRTALTGLLETMGIVPGSSGVFRGGGSSRNSRVSDRSDEMRGVASSGHSERERERGETALEGDARWSSLLLANERVVYATPISVRPPTSLPVPNFLLPAPKRRHLILTDFPRLIVVRDEDGSGPKVKGECVFVPRPSTGSTGSGSGTIMVAHASSSSSGAGSGGANRVVDVVERGHKAFVVHTVGQSWQFIADSADIKVKWMDALKKVAA
ncbi:hypothetical protein BCR39DRAFT_534303 [Naematelia encephala]|uniref:non-specific serine/threonine protein kinase n=1 Tax=Naematelia encephala TaxID=71784 RepID=A0A1Y2B179_9TREE|nr:hypothetical protein BCR39DRAFT_534303 [Naematelia encephala]